jgi:hypothetical protein
MHRGGADHRGLRQLVEHQRDEARLADRFVAERCGEGLAVDPVIVDPDALVADEQAPSRLVGELDPPVRVDRQQRRRSVVEHGFAEAVRFGESKPLVAKAPDPLVERLADVGEAAAVGAVGEALRQVAEPHRLEEAGELHVGALDVAPQLVERPQAEGGREQPGDSEPLRPERRHEQEDGSEQHRRPPAQAGDEAAPKAHGVVPTENPPPDFRGRGTARSAVEGPFGSLKEPLHHASHGPPPRQIPGRNKGRLKAHACPFADRARRG